VDVEQKSCRQCCLPIAKKARLCPHCHGYQSWVAGQTDPRILLVVLVVFVLFVGFIVFVEMRRGESDDTENLIVKQTQHYVATAPEQNTLYVIGSVTPNNEPRRRWCNAYFRVTVLNAEGKLVDTFLVREKLALGDAGKATPVRVSGRLAVKIEEVQSVSLELVRSGRVSTFDGG
jgi:hypothetical protein